VTGETEPPGVFADFSWSAEAEESEGRVEFSGCLLPVSIFFDVTGVLPAHRLEAVDLAARLFARLTPSDEVELRRRGAEALVADAYSQGGQPQPLEAADLAQQMKLVGLSFQFAADKAQIDGGGLDYEWCSDVLVVAFTAQWQFEDVQVATR